MTTFREAAQYWLTDAQTRRNNPLKPSTLKVDLSYLNNHIIPYIGDVPVEQVSSRMLQECAANWGHLAPQTQSNILKSITKVVNSVTDEDGELIGRFMPNKKLIDLPEVIHAQERTASYTSEEVEAILQRAHSYYRVLYALLAGTGMRPGEALALQVADVGADTISVRGTLWHGEILSPKTRAGERTIDLCSELAEYLWKYIGDSTEGWLFPTSRNTPKGEQNIIDNNLSKVLETCDIPRSHALYAFRRYRASWLELQGCPVYLVNAWMGWSKGKEMRKHYSHAAEWEDVRGQWAEKIALGFSIPD